MLVTDRTFVACYAVIWFIALLNRATDLAVVTTVAQVIFSEQILSRWLRMEWLRSRFERIYDDCYSLIRTTTHRPSKEFRARVVDYLLRYETSKAKAGISLSSSIFRKRNLTLSSQWQLILQKMTPNQPPP
jgi:hypothetical protein